MQHAKKNQFSALHIELLRAGISTFDSLQHVGSFTISGSGRPSLPRGSRRVFWRR